MKYVVVASAAELACVSGGSVTKVNWQETLCEGGWWEGVVCCSLSSRAQCWMKGVVQVSEKTSARGSLVFPCLTLWWLGGWGGRWHCWSCAAGNAAGRNVVVTADTAPSRWWCTLASSAVRCRRSTDSFHLHTFHWRVKPACECWVSPPFVCRAATEVN